MPSRAATYETRWYQLSPEQVFETLETSNAGLTSSEAKVRLGKYGYNELKFKKRGALVRFLQQFNNLFIYILLVAALFTGILNMLTDMSVILAVVLINVIVGFIQEGKAEASIEVLEKMMVPECIVLRDGEEKVIPARELVPGDVVLLRGGDRVPADLRLFYTKNVSADEAALTGESVPVGKSVDPVPRPNLSPGDQRCMAFSGTFITRGSGQGVVVGTGEQTEIGDIAKLMKQTRRITTPLIRKINDFIKFLVTVILTIGAVSFTLGILFGYDITYNFLASVSLIVAAIPEGLPAIITIALAIGAMAMAKRNALIKRLPAAEALGCTTVICSDKTGTLTKDQMTVLRIYCGGKDYEVSGVGYEPRGEFILRNKRIAPVLEDKELVETLRAGYLCNNTTLVEDKEGYNIVGDPTEGALVVSATKAGVTQKLPRLDEIPFEAEQQYMATLHESQGGNIIYVKGSPERILKMCQSQLIDGSVEPLRSEDILDRADEMARGALRLLGTAYKTVPRKKTWLEPEDFEGLIFLGLQGMIDPPREEVIEAIRKCKTAGIRSVMVTGDHAQTARAIAQQLGVGEGEDRALTGEGLSGMSDEELYEAVDKVSVYARVRPEHKLRIAQQLQRKGHIVAMTGDGVNDAPALKAADIGVAMGITGTEVSKEASDMVLADDNFASIVSAVEEGRHLFQNLWKLILYTLATNGGQTLLVFGAVALAPFIPLFALRLPISPVQILWINLYDAVALALPFIWEPREKGLLERPPRDPKEKIANRLFFLKVGLVSVVMAAAGFAVYYRYGASALSGSVDEQLLIKAGTAAFMTVMLVHLFYVFTARSLTESVFTFNPLSNKVLLIGIALTLALQFTLVYAPPYIGFNPLGTAPFPAEWWGFMILAALPGLLVIELEKFLRRRLGKATS